MALQSKWSPEQIEYLKNNYQFGAKHCASRLIRTLRSVQVKASKLGIYFRPKAREGFLFCSDCEQEKPEEEFSRCRSPKTKRQRAYYCKECAKKRLETLEYKTSMWSCNTVGNHRRMGFKVLIKSKDLTQKARQTKTCLFCCQPLNWFNENTNHDSPTLERLNNEQTMTPENTAIICHRCNATKGNRTLQQFMDYIKLVLPNIQTLVDK